MRESRIERRAGIGGKNAGRPLPEIYLPRLDGAPDRLTLLPRGRMAFVELKAPGKTLRPLQRRRREQLERLGFRVFVVDGVEQIGGVLDAIQAP